MDDAKSTKGSRSDDVDSRGRAAARGVSAFVDLVTERLRLRRFQAADVEDALAYRNDREFGRFLPHIPFPFTREDAEKFVALNMSEDWQTSPTFAVVLGEKLVGTVNFEIEGATQAAMLGYALGREWWGRGLATEAATVAVEWARRAHRLRRVWASTDVRNERSQRVLQKLGFARESVRPAQQRDRDGNVVDEVKYILELPA